MNFNGFHKTNMKIKKYNISNGVTMKRKLKSGEKIATMLKPAKKTARKTPNVRLKNYYEEEIEIPVKIVRTAAISRAKKTPVRPKLLRSENADLICQAQDFIFIQRDEWLKTCKKTFLGKIRTAISTMLIFGLITGQALSVFGYEAKIINVTARICGQQSEVRSMGYWKTHPETYSGILPQTLGGIGSEDQLIENQTEADKVFTDYNLSMRNKLRGQLLAMKFNIAWFSIGAYLVEAENKTLDQLVAEADNLLSQDPPPADSVLENFKNIIESVNILEKIRFCAVPTPTPTSTPTPTPTPECILNIVKAVDKTEAAAGDTLTYTLDFTNTGTADCTGGGVKVKDVVDPNLTYLSETHSANVSPGYGGDPAYNNSTRTLLWNAGVLNPGESGSVSWKGKINLGNGNGDDTDNNDGDKNGKDDSNDKNYTSGDNHNGHESDKDNKDDDEDENDDSDKCGSFDIPNIGSITSKEYSNFSVWINSNEVHTKVSGSSSGSGDSEENDDKNGGHRANNGQEFNSADKHSDSDHSSSDNSGCKEEDEDDNHRNNDEESLTGGNGSNGGTSEPEKTEEEKPADIQNVLSGGYIGTGISESTPTPTPEVTPAPSPLATEGAATSEPEAGPLLAETSTPTPTPTPEETPPVLPAPTPEPLPEPTPTPAVDAPVVILNSEIILPQ